jgi:hypothetical protein
VQASRIDVERPGRDPPRPVFAEQLKPRRNGATIYQNAAKILAGALTAS